MEVPQQSLGYSFPVIIYRLRVVQLIALVLQICILFMESDRIGKYFVIPVAVHCVNLYHTGKRFYYNIDGRFDFSQMLTVKNLMLKAKYASALFGSILLAVTSHYLITKIPAILSALIYYLSDYATLIASMITVSLEIYKSVKEKMK